MLTTKPQPYHNFLASCSTTQRNHQDSDDAANERPWRRRPVVDSPNPPPRPDWLTQIREPSLAPDQKIVDAHHHLWDRQGFRYLLEEFTDDIGDSGHWVTASIYIQCRTMYRASGPEAYRSVGEIEFVRGLSAQSRSGHYGPTDVATAIVGYADLLMGASVTPVLEALMEAGGGRFRGVRMPVAAHPDPTVRSNPVPAPEGLMVSKPFVEGARQLSRLGLSLDIWAYQTQLDEVATLARRLPELTIVLDHAGGPLGVGSYPSPHSDHNSIHRQAWRDGLARLAKLPNVMLKIGGFGMPIMGFSFNTGKTPPNSQHLADAIAPDVDACIERFTPSRCMLESNFPVDKGSISYGVLWNAYHRLTASWSQEERNAVFHDTATRVYRLPAGS
ncbi:hypothetical protein EHLJMEHL_00491 [Vreelandella titanicae]